MSRTDRPEPAGGAGTGDGASDTSPSSPILRPAPPPGRRLDGVQPVNKPDHLRAPVTTSCQDQQMTERMREELDRNLALELVRVTEAAALAAGRWVGRGDKEGGD